MNGDRNMDNETWDVQGSVIPLGEENERCFMPPEDLAGGGNGRAQKPKAPKIARPHPTGPIVERNMIDQLVPTMSKAELRVMLILKRWAIDNGSGTLTKSEVAKRAGLCYSAAWKAIVRLQELGIVKWVSHGRYRMNWYRAKELSETIQETVDRAEVS